MMVMHIHKDNFQAQVLESDKKVLLDFWAPWCRPCQMIGPVMEEVAQLRPDVLVGKVNIDEEMELASQFQVMSIPTLVVLEKGQTIKREVGARGRDAILALLDE